MQRAGAMNLLSFLMNDMTEENRKLKLIIFPGETVVMMNMGNGLLPVRQRMRQKNISGNRRNDIDETEQGRHCYCKSGVSK